MISQICENGGFMAVFQGTRMNKEERQKAFHEGRTGEEPAQPLTRKQKEELRRAARRRQLRQRFALFFAILALIIGGIVLAVTLHERSTREAQETAEETGRTRRSSKDEDDRTKPVVDNTTPEAPEGTSGEAPASEGQTEAPQTEAPSTAPVVTQSSYDVWLASMHELQGRLPDWITQDYIEVNKFSRPCIALDAVNNIVIHYVGNPDTSGLANLNYFKSLALQDPDAPNPKMASSNFIVGLEGEVYECMPIYEKAYCSNNRNSDTLSIEVCHPDAEGKFNDATYESLIRLCAFLCHETGLTGDDLIRHYDVTGKMCPLYYVEHPEAWTQLKADVNARIQQDYGN